MRSHIDFCKHPQDHGFTELVRVLALYHLKENKLQKAIEQGKPLIVRE